jgi:hypothetical protein
MNDHRINTNDKTSTGNQCAYFLSGHHGIESPVWEFPIGPESLEELQHAEALQINRDEFPNVHIHWSEESRDCDGGHGDYGIHRPHSRYLNDDGSVNLYDFWNAEVRFTLYVQAIEGTLKVTSDPYDRYSMRAEWHETTEEGFRHREISVCVDECDEPRNTVYDQYAQEAGY